MAASDEKAIRVGRLDLSKVGREGIPDDVSNMHWGPISRELCERELSEHPFGTFLLRQRLENPKDHVLSTITAKGFFHIIIQETADGSYQTSSRTFSKLSDVVKDYQSRGLKEPLLREQRTGKEAAQQMFKWIEADTSSLSSPPPPAKTSSSSSVDQQQQQQQLADLHTYCDLPGGDSQRVRTVMPSTPSGPYLADVLVQHEETTYSSEVHAAQTKRGGSWTAVPLTGDESGVDVGQLRLVTFNVWFDGFMQQERASRLFEICADCQADVICLQEVTAPFLAWLLALPWVRRHYYVNDIEGNTWGTWYGVLILTRFLPSKIGILGDFPTNQGRRFCYVDVQLNRELFRIGTVHLESFARSTNFRIAQLDRIYPILASPVVDHSALLGDMNLCSTWTENERAFYARPDEQQHCDVWSELRKDDAGYTENTDINTMRLTSPNQGHEKKVRFDRIFLRSTASKWRPVSIELLGTAPISPNVWPSDHFGLFAVLRYSADWDAQQHSLPVPALHVGQHQPVSQLTPESGYIQTDVPSLPQDCYVDDF